VTLKPTVLSAVYSNGKKIIGEHNIDERTGIRNEELEIRNLQLKSNGSANPKAIAAIKNADLIIFGPGDLHTSILPNLLVLGVAEAINKSKAKKVLVINIMTKFGQTDGFKVSNFVSELEKYLGGKLDVAIVNNKVPGGKLLKRYSQEKAKPVKMDDGGIKKFSPKIVVADLLSDNVFSKSNGDKLKRSFLRHDSDKLAKLIWKNL
jgi:uncharacterized cofD-like protein